MLSDPVLIGLLACGYIAAFALGYFCSDLDKKWKDGF